MIGTDLLKEALGRNSTDAPLTHEEVNRICEAMDNDKDGQFQKLLSDYVKEISDPKAKEENELYLKQLEEQNEVPEGKELLRPTIGYALKFNFIRASSASLPLFCNIVQSEKVSRPSFTKVEKGKQWSLPYILSPLRMEYGSNNSSVPTFDCCFHPETLTLGEKDLCFKDLIVNTAKDCISKQYESMKSPISFLPEYTVLKSNYKSGIPGTMLIPCSKPTPTSTSTPSSSLQKKTETKGVNSSNFKSLKKGFLLNKDKSDKGEHTGLKEVSSKRKVPFLTIGNDAGLVTPHYTVVEQTNFDLGDQVNLGEICTNRPTCLEYKISLPKANNVSDLDLDLASKDLVLRGCSYFLDIKLPYEVDETSSIARFDKTTSILTVKLPLLSSDSKCDESNVKTGDSIGNGEVGGGGENHKERKKFLTVF
ncbi:hypothetical protein CTEN210_16757 [Chaetoceros tenuissimus]|uniref:PIH1 domain-containing protein 1 n=1 Tax=Chaetoceros tenuissimus TaxID=426638 RepID=A0AAD3D9D6_9STRA|nr:hypothetical protein CTEN210_16757 [Chaetoceros tenuissimus]